MAPNLSGWRILVMEDDGLLAMHLSDILDDLGHTVIGPSRTVQDALAIIERESVDIALLDVNLGNGETSYPVAEQLDRQGIPFAFLTGYGETGVRKTFQNRPVVPKPVSEAHLVETLRQLRNG
jgi:CheY-like chemotaxis protein